MQEPAGWTQEELQELASADDEPELEQAQEEEPPCTPSTS